MGLGTGYGGIAPQLPADTLHCSTSPEVGWTLAPRTWILTSFKRILSLTAPERELREGNTDVLGACT